MQKEQDFQTLFNGKLRVTASGFENKTKKVFEQYIAKIGGIYSDLLKMDTNILISTNVLSEKYRGACLLNIPIVSSNWLEDSFSQERFLPPDNYRIKIFKGVTIGIIGFDINEANEIKDIVKANEGEIITSLNTIQEDKSIDIIIGKSSELKKFDNFFLNLKTPTVTIDWLKNCLISRINAPKSITRQSAGQRANEALNTLSQIEGHLNKVLQEAELNDPKWNYLEKSVIYLHRPMNSKIERIQKKLIEAGGGIWVEENNSYVTHIVAEEYLESDIKSLNQFREAKVLNIFWLKDCLIYQRLVKEDDYIMIPIPPAESLFNALKGNIDLTALTLQRRNTLSMASQSSQDEFSSAGTKSWGSQTLNPLLIRSNSAITTSLLPPESSLKNNHGRFLNKTTSLLEKVQQSSSKTVDPMGKSKSKVKKEVVKVKTQLLKNVNFMFDPKFDKNTHIHYKRIILENSGKIIENLNVFEEIYYLLPDCEASFGILKKKEKSKNIKFVSPRWIDYSLQNKFITKDIEAKKLIQLLPFPFQLPVPEFKNKTIYCAGFSPYDKKIMKEVIELFGAKFSYDNPNELHYLICGDKTSKKFTEIKDKCPTVKVLNPNWVFDSIKQGNILDIDSYIIQNCSYSVLYWSLM